MKSKKKKETRGRKKGHKERPGFRVSSTAGLDRADLPVVRTDKIPIEQARAMMGAAFKFGHKRRAFETPDDLVKAFIVYAQWCEANPSGKYQVAQQDGAPTIVALPVRRPWSAVGFCLFSGLSVDYLDELFSRSQKKNDVGFVTVIKSIRRSIAQMQIDGAMQGYFNANLTARLNGIGENVNVNPGVDGSGVLPPPNVYNNAPPLAGNEDDVKD